MPNDRRLIEDYLPIEAISKEATREKSIRKGHISTLHLWWARRPLVACRAAVYGSLVPADQFESREEAADFVTRLCKYPGAATVIAEAQRHILAAHARRLSEETGKEVTVADIEAGRAPRPKVLDMFAGGGAIPLEALRLGCDAYAMDLNPVAYIIELCTLVYPQKYGRPDPTVRGMTGPKNENGETTWGGLAEEVRYWGNWVLRKVKAEIGDLYPLIPDPDFKDERVSQEEAMRRWLDDDDVPPGYLLPVAYLWTRTVKCKNPSCGATVPLVKQTWLCKKKGRYVALKIIAPPGEKEVRFDVVETTEEKDLGFDPSLGSKAGSATCPFCGTVADSKYVKVEGCAERLGQRMMAIVCTKPGSKGKFYLSADDCPQFIPNYKAILKRIGELRKSLGFSVPDEPIVTDAKDSCWTYRYGIKTFDGLFNLRQILFLSDFATAVREEYRELITYGYGDNYARAIITNLGLLQSTISNSNSAVCRWIPQNQQMGSTFSRNGIPMAWDYAEINPLGGGSGDTKKYLNRLIQGIEAAQSCTITSEVKRGNAGQLPWISESIDAVITDPPYYDNIPYADLSDFFYVWLKRSIGNKYEEHFSTVGTPKKNEAVADALRVGGNKNAAKRAYEEMMTQSLVEAYRVLKPGGQIAIVYAHKTTSGWAILVNSLRKAGFTVTEAWPLDTEKPGRVRAINSAALASSIFLVARKRDGSSTGSYEDEVRPELDAIVRERVDSLWKLGITGGDLIIAAIGAGLKPYTQFTLVEYANGQEVPAEKFVAEVEGVVLDVILERIFGVDHSGVEAVDAPTRFYVLWRYVYKGGEVDAGEAIVFALGLQIELNGAHGASAGVRALLEKKKGKYRLRDFAERGANEHLGLPDGGRPAPLIDVLHRLLWLLDNEAAKVNAFLDEANPDAERLRVVAQALSGTALSGKRAEGNGKLIATTDAEESALGKLLASWRSVVEKRLGKEEGKLF